MRRLGWWLVVYLNPLRKAQVTPNRIDQGVDYTGSGPIFALGPGVIREVHNSGWPGGTFIAEQLTSGPDSGQYVYYAEGITPTVPIGTEVGARDVVGNINGSIEVGWAAPPPNLGEALAMKLGEASSTGDAGTGSTGEGVSFSNLIQSLGGPPGIHQPGPTKGAVPGPGGGGGTGPVSTTGSGGVLGDIGQSLISGLIQSLGVPSLGDAVKRLGLILLGGALVIMGIIALTNRSKVQTAVNTGKDVTA